MNNGFQQMWAEIQKLWLYALSQASNKTPFDKIILDLWDIHINIKSKKKHQTFEVFGTCKIAICPKPCGLMKESEHEPNTSITISLLRARFKPMTADQIAVNPTSRSENIGLSWINKYQRYC